MPSPKFVPNPPDGSGLIGQLVEQDYQDLVRGKPAELRVARVMFQAVGTSLRKTKDGIKTTTVYEVVRLEPCRDQHDADTVTWEIGRSYEGRTSGGSQEMLPLNSPAEQRESLIEALFEWAGEQDVSQTDLDERWTSYFGGRVHAASETVRAGALVQLLEFARYVGAVDDPKISGEPDDEGTDEDVEQDLAEPDAGDEQDEAATGTPAAPRAVPFQTGS